MPSDRLARVLAELDDQELLHALRLRERDREFAARLGAWAPDGLDSAQALQVREAIERVHRDGYAVIPGFLQGDRLARLRDGLEPAFDGCRRISERLGQRFSSPGASRPQTVHVANLLAKTAAADGVVTDPLLLSLVSGVLGPEFQLNTCVAMCPDPGTAAQAMHRDEAFFRLYGHRAYGYPRMPVVANTLIAIDDFTRENGATQLVPGSQTWGEARRPQGGDVVYNEIAAGTLIIFDGSMLHAGGGNSSRDGRRRRSLNINFTRDWLRTQENHYLSIPRERILSMPERLQQLLGYAPSKGGLGKCDYQDPLKYLKRLVALGDGSQPLLAHDAVVDPRVTRAKL